MGAEPIAFLNCDVRAGSFHVKVGRLKHSSFVFPNRVYFCLGELVLSEKSDDPSKEFSLVGIVEIVVILIGVGIALYAFFDVSDVSNCSDLSCGFVEEHFSCILDH
jgi:hypothetical protein